MRSTRARLDRVPSGLPTSRYEFRRQPVNVLIDSPYRVGSTPRPASAAGLLFFSDFGLAITLSPLIH